MRKNQSSILIVGTDEHLNATRQWVLQTRGYQVVAVARPELIQRVAKEAPVRLVVLCHSLTEQECRRAADSAARRWPGVKHLVLTAESQRMPTGLLGQLLHTMDGPAKLLSMVSDLVGTSAELHNAPRA